MGFLILCIASATINAGAVAIVTAAIVKMAIPSLMFDAGTVAALIMASCLIIW
ncbi:membrane protein [Neisseria gonorrhoeae]|uniref:Membrane protein n=1 Tax=Neisseria gonorrhoeae TaxID=485 RepID=A0A378VTR9_NEIGO|nr:membrane protein [Neisseria gonorrhoeae]